MWKQKVSIEMKLIQKRLKWFSTSIKTQKNNIPTRNKHEIHGISKSMQD